MVLVRTPAKLAAAAVAVDLHCSDRVIARPGRRPGGAERRTTRLRLTADRALAFVQAADDDLTHVPGEVLVKFKDGVSVAGQQRALRALRSRPSPSDLRWVGDVALWTDPAESDATILAAQLGEQPEVAYAEPNRLYHLSLTPNDPGFGPRQWNLSAIDMPRAWDINPGGSSAVTVAVIDSGITTIARSFVFQTWNGRATQSVVVPFGISPDFAASRLVNPRDFVFWDGPVVDMEGHGTHVASTIGEDTNNAVAGAGIAYGVNVMPLKVCVGYWEVQFAMSASGYRGYVPQDSGGCAESEIAEAIRYAADSGAKVINLSLGGPEPSTDPPGCVDLRGWPRRVRGDCHGERVRRRQRGAVPGGICERHRRRDVCGRCRPLAGARLLFEHRASHRDFGARRQRPRRQRRQQPDLAGHDPPDRLRSRAHRPAAVRPVRRGGVPRHVDGQPARGRRGRAHHQPGGGPTGCRRGAHQGHCAVPWRTGSQHASQESGLRLWTRSASNGPSRLRRGEVTR